MSLQNAVRSEKSIEIKDVGHSKVLINNNKDLLDDPTYWHKFIILNVHGLDRDNVLKLILDHVYPLDLIPLSYCKNEDGCGASFFARLCKPVIEKIIYEDNLMIVFNNNPDAKPLRLNFILRFTTTKEVKVDLSKNIIQVLVKRFKKTNACIKLDNFEKDPELTEFCILSQPKIMAFILSLVKPLKPLSVELNNNGIKSLEPIKILRGLKLESIDLRNNEITDLNELVVLRDHQIKEMRLEGNPVCGIYDEYNYTHRIMECCPKLEKLDGFVLRQHGFPSFRRNYSCNAKVYSWINNFLEVFFTCYDLKDMDKMSSLYGKEALFSITANFSRNQFEILHYNYQTYSRNLRVPSKSHQDTEDKNLKNLWQGSRNILKLFNLLPQTEHDPYSFTVDLSYYSKTHAVLAVAGVFRHVPVISGELYGFSRTFVLQLSDDDDDHNNNNNFIITNEQLHVFDAKYSQQITGFKYKSQHQILPPAQNTKQKHQLVCAMALITNLTHDWCKKFLEECRYDLKQALILFMNLIDKMPPCSFINES